MQSNSEPLPGMGPVCIERYSLLSLYLETTSKDIVVLAPYKRLLPASNILAVHFSQVTRLIVCKREIGGNWRVYQFSAYLTLIHCKIE